MNLNSFAVKMRPRLCAGLLVAALAMVGVGLNAGTASAAGVVSAGAVPGSSYIIHPDTGSCPSNYGYGMLGSAPLHCSFEDVYSLYPGRWSPWVKTARPAAEHVFYANGVSYYMTTGGICYH